MDVQLTTANNAANTGRILCGRVMYLRGWLAAGHGTAHGKRTAKKWLKSAEEKVIGLAHICEGYAIIERAEKAAA